MTGSGVRADSRAWFGHPPGLTILFLTEMWEVFSYYGMRALLVYYMTRELAIDQAHASLIYGLYTATAYLTPIFGGPIADRWLGKQRAVIIGGSIMALGHFMMAFPPLLYAALATIALGNGLFLPSLPSQIDGLYAPDDSRKDRAFNVYYVGINLGGFLAPLVCGALGEFYGWHWGFGAAGVGMLLGLAVYVLGAKHLPPRDTTPRGTTPRGTTPRETATPSAPVSANARRPARLGAYGQTFFLLFAIGVAVTVFRGAYEQIGNTLALWADTGIDRRAGSLTLPMTWFQSLNPLLVFLMTPLLLAHWRRQTALGREHSPLRKMAIGAAIVGVAYLLVAGVALSAGAARASWVWLALFYGVFTLGELYILPTGLGLFARWAPPGFGATMIAAWFVAIFSGSLSAGAIGTLWGRMSHAAYFMLLAALAGLAATLLMALDPRARRVEASQQRARSERRLAQVNEEISCVDPS
jgi:POT family proton-dependent oligopeptide transporter